MLTSSQEGGIAGRASKGAGRASEGAGRASEGAGRASGGAEPVVAMVLLWRFLGNGCTLFQTETRDDVDVHGQLI